MVTDDFIRRITIDLNNKLKEEVETPEQKRNREPRTWKIIGSTLTRAQRGRLKMTYTKGEWVAYKDDLTRNCYAIDLKHKPHDKIDTEIALVYRGVDDANLISATPDMYEALKAVNDYFTANYPKNMVLKKIANEKAENALKKAEGK